MWAKVAIGLLPTIDDSELTKMVISMEQNKFLFEKKCDFKILPKEGSLTLAKIRKYQINDTYAAMIAEDEGSGWSIFSNEDYKMIVDFFAHSVPKIEALDAGSKTVIENLWNNNLVFIDKKSYKHTFIDIHEKKHPSFLVIKVTGSCNFACSYCYDHDINRQTQQLDFTQVGNTIDFLLTKNNLLNIVFHGGEPLLQFALIKKIVTTTNQKLQQKENTGKKVIYSIQTNGSLLSEEVITFLTTNQVRVGISLDGYTEKANANRRSKDGNTSSLDAFLKLCKRNPDFVKKSCGMLGVLHSDNIHETIEFIEWLQDLGVAAIYFNVVHPNNSERGRNLASKTLSADEISWFYQQLISEIKSGKINKIDAANITHFIGNLFFLRSSNICINKGPCGAAKDFLTINNDGKMQTCDCLPATMGTINADIVNNQIRSFVKNTWQKFKEQNCKDCSLFGLCGGGCIADSYFNSGCKEVETARCIAAKLIYRELFGEIVAVDKRPLINYFLSLQRKEKK